MPTQTDIQYFQQLVKDYFDAHSRKLVWRLSEADGSFDAYKILVSEVMLQQTQVARVVPKYQTFLKEFPTVAALARAPLAQVLIVWNGLGYNRRAQYLHQAARQLLSKPQPWSYEDLMDCKGVGANTAAAICVYAYNQPLVFIETNIRSVLIYHLLESQLQGPTLQISDKELLPIVKKMLVGQDPRTFYWALMDYGAYVKFTAGNLSIHSKHFVRQSSFAGSRRQLRGRVIRLLTDHSYKYRELLKALADERAESVIADLANEGMIARRAASYQLK